jgi:hypothetical protein
VKLENFALKKGLILSSMYECEKMNFMSCDFVRRFSCEWTFSCVYAYLTVKSGVAAESLEEQGFRLDAELDPAQKS